MSELQFTVGTEWSGTGRGGEGHLTISGETYPISAPENMGGKGAGISPEDLLISAVTSCYSGTLFGILRKSGLPVQRIQVRAEGIVDGYPLRAKFSRLIVHPTVCSGDKVRAAEYEKAAVSARDKCFIGKTISGNVEYEVGEVQVVPALMTQGQVDELVERFYASLTRDSYYSKMFAERDVDVDQLKERQRAFIMRLANPEPLSDQYHDVHQVRERHHFGVNPEQAEKWIALMEKTMKEMKLAEDMMSPLLEKMRFLVNRMIKQPNV